MHGRVDQAIYQISTAEMLNFVPTIEGPAMKRAGFRHIRAAAADATWLSPFIFSVTQAYVLEWGDRQAALLHQRRPDRDRPGVAYEVTSPTPRPRRRSSRSSRATTGSTWRTAAIRRRRCCAPARRPSAMPR
jgi:hypothetical protein